MKRFYTAPIAELVEAETDDLLTVSFHVDIDGPVDPIGGGGEEYGDTKPPIGGGGDEYDVNLSKGGSIFDY